MYIDVQKSCDLIMSLIDYLHGRFWSIMNYLQLVVVISAFLVVSLPMLSYRTLG